MITNIEVSTKVLDVRGAVNIALLSKKTNNKQTFRIRKDPTKGTYKTFLNSMVPGETPKYLGMWSKNHYGKLVYRRSGVKKDLLRLGEWLYKYIQHPCLYDKTVECTMLWQNLL